MKSVDWQQKMLRGNVRMSRMKDTETSEKRSKKMAEHRTKYTSRMKKSSSSIVTSSKCIILFSFYFIEIRVYVQRDSQN